MSSAGVGTRVAVTTMSCPSGTDDWARAELSEIPKSNAGSKTRLMRSSVEA
jgi:hypothetical protein